MNSGARKNGDKLYDSGPIASVATMPGRAGIAVVRVSGDGAFEICKKLLVKPSSFPAPGEFHFGILRDPSTNEQIDEAVILAFRAPRSYTGEDVVEYQVHGGKMASRRVMEALEANGVRPSLPGEFTKRAFLNGRIDLSQAEAVMDMVSAQSNRAAKCAFEQLRGSISSKITDEIYEPLVAIIADVEASLDFAEDEVPEMLSAAAIRARMLQVCGAIKALSSTYRNGRMIREGVSVVLSGRPNSGKSTLFNALLGWNRAIVDSVPGTTRDTIEESLEVRGVPVRIIDTAGIRSAECEAERQGVDRARESIEKADVNIRILDISNILEDDVALLCGMDGSKTLVALNKADLADAAKIETTIREIKGKTAKGLKILAVSAMTGAGVENLIDEIAEIAGMSNAGGNEDVAVELRHKELLDDAHGALTRAISLLAPSPGGDTLAPVPDAIATYADAVAADGAGVDDAKAAGSTAAADSAYEAVDCGDVGGGCWCCYGYDAVLVAQKIREAAEYVGEITGMNVSEDALDRIFSRFCIGK